MYKRQDLPLFRLAEVYLNYVEAKAELGTLTQTDIDNTVNKLRTHAGITGKLNMNAANLAPDLLRQRIAFSWCVRSSPTTIPAAARRQERTARLRPSPKNIMIPRIIDKINNPVTIV